MKTCPHCGVTKALAGFNRDHTGAQGRHTWCRECEHAYSKQHYEQNRERLLKERREQWASRSEEQKERDRATSRAYRERNRDRLRAADREVAKKKREERWAKKREEHQQRLREIANRYSRPRSRLEELAAAGEDVQPTSDPLEILANFARRLDAEEESAK